MDAQSGRHHYTYIFAGSKHIQSLGTAPGSVAGSIDKVERCAKRPVQWATSSAAWVDNTGLKILEPFYIGEVVHHANGEL